MRHRDKFGNPVDIRTYRQLVEQTAPTCSRGTCCACHRWDAPTWQLSTRASICKACADRKGDQTLGSIVTSERRAKRWIKRHPDLHGKPEFIANISGASLDFVRAEISKVKRGAM